jgi:hypothetical protein
MARNGSKLKRMSAYVVKDQDPLIGILGTLQRTSKVKDATIYREGGPSPGTLRNWRTGKTRRCLVATAASTAIILGLDSLPITPAARKRLLDNNRQS